MIRRKRGRVKCWLGAPFDCIRCAADKIHLSAPAPERRDEMSGITYLLQDLGYRISRSEKSNQTIDRCDAPNSESVSATTAAVTGTFRWLTTSGRSSIQSSVWRGRVTTYTATRALQNICGKYRESYGQCCILLAARLGRTHSLTIVPITAWAPAHHISTSRTPQKIEEKQWQRLKTHTDG